MRIAIIGAGNVGKALATGWSRAGHDILFGVAHPDDARYAPIVQAIASATLLTVGDAAARGDVIVLAVPWDAVPDALGACGPLADRVVIDVTNPLKFGANGLELAIGFDRSGGEEVARLAPGAAVFKSINQVGSAVMADAGGYAVRPVMFVAGDDEARKPIVMGLVADLGFDAIDAGPLRLSRLLEPFAMLWIDQAMNRGAAATNAFAFLRKSD